ncbi:hypothetical protein INR49_012257 [Caranx melampygus]|nr:hypothetical protein INR49_012257 [Caranx melampygus]
MTENGSALHEAALFGKMDVVRLLLDSGGSINVTQQNKNSQKLACVCVVLFSLPILTCG